MLLPQFHSTRPFSRLVAIWSWWRLGKCARLNLLTRSTISGAERWLYRRTAVWAAGARAHCPENQLAPE